MSTGDTWLELGPTSLLNLEDLTTGLRTNVLALASGLRFDVFPEDGTIGAAKVSLTYNAGHYLIVGAGVGVDNAGNRMESDGASPWNNCPFPDTAAVAYSIGARYQLRPSSVTGNTADGAPAYDQVIEDVGELGAPDLVTDNGDGTLTIRVDGLVGAGWAAGQSKPAAVYLVTPASAVTADAIYQGTVVVSGGHYVIQVPHTLGQATASTTVGDYVVIVRGPKVSAIGLTSDYWVLGTCNTGVVNTSPQHLHLSPGTWGTVFGAEHNTGTGVHTTITAQSVTVGGVPGIKVLAKGLDGADDTNSPKFQAVDSGNNAQVEAWTDATCGGRLKFPAASMGTRVGGGALIDARTAGGGAGTVALYLTNDRSNTDYADLMIDGVIRWNALKSANNWRLATNQAGNKTLQVINENGAFRADLALQAGDLWVSGGKITAGGVGLDLTGASAEINYLTARNRTGRLAPWLNYTVLQGTATPDTSGTPPLIQSGSATLPVTIAIPINTPMRDGSSSGLVLQSVQVWYRRTTAGSSITAQVYRVDNSGGSAKSAVGGAMTASDTSGAWVVTGMSVSSIAHTISGAHHYWIEITIDPDAAANDAQVCGVSLSFDQSKIAA